MKIIFTASFFCVFLGTFVNDFVFIGFHGFYFFWIGCLILRIVQEVKFSDVEILVQILLISFLLSSIFLEFIYYGPSYWNYYLFAVLYVNFIPLFLFLFKRPRLLGKIVIILIFWLFLFSLYSIQSGALRSELLFGPNVLYRMFCFLLMVFVMSAWKSSRTSRIMIDKSIVCVALMALVCVAATGSRGGIVTLMLSLFFIIYFSNWWSWKLMIGFTALSPFFILSLAKIIEQSVFWRLIYFDLENNSEATRLGFYSIAYDYLVNDISTLKLLIGSGSGGQVFNFYPHNLFLESFVYGGVMMLVLSSLYFFHLIGSFFKINNNYLSLIAVFFPIFVGSLFSGNLSYNFPVITVGVFLTLTFFIRQIFYLKWV